jgi:hypothetical protein
MKTYKEYRPPIAVSDAQQCSPRGNGHEAERSGIKNATCSTDFVSH